jgi:hypothetical protein
LIEKALEGDTEETRRMVTDLINQKIDIPESGVCGSDDV